MRKLCLFFAAAFAFSPLWALRCGDNAAELPARMTCLNGLLRPVAAPAEKGKLRVVTFIHTRVSGAAATVNMISSLGAFYRGRAEMTVITPDPESDAAVLRGAFRGSPAAYAVDSGRRVTMQYMAGSLLYPKSFVIDHRGVIIWCGETVDLGEMMQEYFSGKFNAAAAAKVCPMLDELQALLRESSERKMKQQTQKIFAVVPAHPAALRMRLFALENTGRIPAAWELLQEQMKAAPVNARLYFTVVDFISRYGYFVPQLRNVLRAFEQNIKSGESRCMMALELLKRFKYQLVPLEYAHRLLGNTAPSDLRFRSAWFAARAQAAYMAGDLKKAIRYQQQVRVPGGTADPMLEYFKGVEKLQKQFP